MSNTLEGKTFTELKAVIKLTSAGERFVEPKKVDFGGIASAGYIDVKIISENQDGTLNCQLIDDNDEDSNGPSFLLYPSHWLHK